MVFDEEIARRSWIVYASKLHGWPEGVDPLRQSVYGPFVIGWHESEYQIYKEGFIAGLKLAAAK